MRSNARRVGEPGKPPARGSDIRFLLVIAAFFPLGLAAMATSARATDCLTYEKPVALAGLVSLVWGWGPLGYGEDPKHDQKGQYAVMLLDESVCVTGGDPRGGDEDAYNVAQVQLVSKDSRKFEKSLLGKPVVVKGRLFHRISGGVTDVMIEYDAVSLRSY